MASRWNVLLNVVRGYSSLSAQYNSLVTAGKLSYDSHQFEVVKKLDEIRTQLSNNDYNPPVPPSQSSSLISKFLSHSKESEKRRVIKGAYMHGSVGSGKTMLMDMFFQSVDLKKKQRCHFNEFMLGVHSRIHAFKERLPKSSGRSVKLYDPIGHVARDIASNVNLLCFDEFQVTDITDAMILKGLFTSLFGSGVIVVATSNRSPEDLYKNGLQRGNFLPFIDVLKEYCHIIQLDSIDYRKELLLSGRGVYLTPNSADNNSKLFKLFNKLVEEKGGVISRAKLKFLGRELIVEKSHDTLAYFHFDELCNCPLSAADYIELCRRFDTIFIQDIPCITQQMRTQARRFITLIDTLYDHKIKLVCTAEGSPQQLFRIKNNLITDNEDTRQLIDDLQINQREAESYSLFTGEEELFAYDRTISRLHEMQIMLFQLIMPKLSVDPHLLRDPQRFIPKVKGLSLFPEWLEEKLRPMDDTIIEFVQFIFAPLTAFMAKLISMFFSVEVAAFLPYLYIFVGWDRAVLSVLSQSIVLLIVSQAPKRLMWRFRPYMVNRARMGCSDKTSSFPARTVTCGVVFTYILHLSFLSYNDPTNDGLFVFYMIITILYVFVAFVTSISRIIVGAHYPSDCFVGVFQGILSCVLGECLYSSFMSCSKHVIHANEVAAWSWSNVDYTHFIVVTSIGFVLVLVGSSHSLSLWGKLPLISSLLFPSMVFARLMCISQEATDSVAYYLSPPIISFEHYIVLCGLFGGILITYKYVQLKKHQIFAMATYYLMAHLSILVILMFHRLHPPADNVTIKNGIGDDT